MIHPVVLCGGSGTRLWPRSRKQAPKPFLPLVEERTLFEATLGRLPVQRVETLDDQRGLHALAGGRAAVGVRRIAAMPPVSIAHVPRLRESPNAF